MLWDARFLLRFDPARAPDRVRRALRAPETSVRVEAEGAWWWPRVVLVRPGGEEVVLARVRSAEMRWMPDLRGLEGLAGEGAAPAPVGAETGGWVEIEFVRLLDAV